MNVQAQLVPVDGGPAIDIVKDLTVVGRKEDCDLHLDHKSISKVHCIIVKTDGLLLIRDLGSTNGTRVNGQRVRRAALLPNDKLTIANLHYRIVLGPAKGPPVSPMERTQAMEAEDLAEALKGPDQPMVDSEIDIPAVSIQANALPDVYQDDKKPAKDKN